MDKIAALDMALTEAVLEKVAEEQGITPEEAAAALAAAAQQGEEEEKEVEAQLELAKLAMVDDFVRVMEKVAGGKATKAEKAAKDTSKYFGLRMKGKALNTLNFLKRHWKGPALFATGLGAGYMTSRARKKAADYLAEALEM